MIVLMTIAMTIFSCLVSGKIGMSAIKDFFTYLPYRIVYRNVLHKAYKRLKHLV